MKRALIDTIIRIKNCSEKEAVEIIMIAATQWDKELAAIAAAKRGRG